MWAYCADNVNFREQSVNIELKTLNKNIVSVSCICHKIHNAMKYAQVALRYDKHV